MQNDNRNYIIFAVVALLVLAYQFVVIDPIQKRRQAEQAQAAAAAATAARQQAPGVNGQPITIQLNRAQALALSPRVQVDTPALSGSVNLKGARIDDLYLKQYRETVSATSAPVELLRPEGTQNAYFALTGWEGANLPGLPNDSTVWTDASGGPLTPDNPLVLTYATPQGLAFTRRIAVDKDAMFTVTDTVANQGAAQVSLTPYGSVQRRGVPATLGRNGIVHEGAIGVLDNNLKEKKYSGWKKDKEQDFSGVRGWLGITDKYWMTVLIPNQAEPLDVKFRVTPLAGLDVYETLFLGPARTIPAGGQITETTHLFAGAKTVPTLAAYGKALGTARFDDAVDWGNFWFLTKPLFTVLRFYEGYVRNFGIAILLLTVTIRLVMFPLANSAYEMGTKMKKVQPQLKALQEKFKDDPQGQQKEMMALYQREKINPVSGCIPILLQIPVFYALTKLFTVTIEMRHAAFFGWIHDLSAPDPTTIWNLFGLIPWDVFGTPWVQALMAFPIVGVAATMILHLAAWPILYAFMIWLSQSMTPMTGVDPMQQRMIQFMPLIFMFVLSGSAVGLVIYWSWSSVITILQTYVIMRRFKVDNPIDDFFGRFSGKKAPA
ncbi:MAG: membrane protein insertase YidC [Caulobacterales bacterium]